MTLLLDTQVLLWWLQGDRRLGDGARAAIGSNQPTAWVSTASVWEATIQFAAGRLRLPTPPDKSFGGGAETRANGYRHGR